MVPPPAWAYLILSSPGAFVHSVHENTTQVNILQCPLRRHLLLPEKVQTQVQVAFTFTQIAPYLYANKLRPPVTDSLVFSTPGRCPVLITAFTLPIFCANYSLLK